MTPETSEMNPSPSELDPAKLASTSIDKVRSTRAKLVDRFEEELTIAVIEGVSTDTTTAIFLLDVELVALKIWDSTPAIMPTLVAEAIIESVVGLGDTISCSVVGSGSFVGFAHSLTGSSAVEEITNEIQDLFSGPLELDGILHHADIRIGTSEVSKAAKSAGQALEQARMALLETSRELPAVIFSPSLELRRRHDEGLEYDLKLALAGGQIDVVFQPIVSLKENRISGVEAFARWTHPEHGAILPPQFLTIAERSGVIRQLGEQVLVKAMKAADLWAQHECLSNIVLWVNFSPTEIAYPDFEPMIKNLIQQYPRVQLGLELAESNVMEERIISTTLRHLRSYGVRTSVDDFSSKDTAVARLRTLPFDNVKISRDLIRGLSSNDDDQAIVQLLSELGSRSDFTVSALGVETEEELTLLRGLGVDCAQGFLLARPVTDAEVGALLKATLTA